MAAGVWWGHAWQGVCVARGACMVGACKAGGACMTGKMAVAVGGTHPTGMHSCCHQNNGQMGQDFTYSVRGAHSYHWQVINFNNEHVLITLRVNRPLPSDQASRI